MMLQDTRLILEERSTGFLSREKNISYHGKNYNQKRIQKSPYDRFISKIDIKDNFFECWEWQGGKAPNGYGIFKISNDFDPITSHRLTYLQFSANIPKGLIVRHYCHNRKCCNPNHLGLGTQGDNINDSVMAKRHIFGENHFWAKLTENQVKEMRLLYATGNYSFVDMDKMFNVGRGTSRAAILRENWKHI